MRGIIFALLPLALLGCVTSPSDASNDQLTDADVRGQWHDTALDRLSSQQQARRIAIVKTDVEIVLHRVVDDPRWLLSEQQRVGNAINKGLHAAVNDLGLSEPSFSNKSNRRKLVPSALRKSPLEAAAPSEVRFQASRLLDNHAQLAAVSDGDEFPTLGRSVLRLSEPLAADLILLSRYRGWRKTRGQWRKEKASYALFNVVSLGMQNTRPLKEFGDLEMLLLDGVSGNLLWRGYISGAPDAVIKSIPLAFKGCWQSGC